MAHETVPVGTAIARGAGIFLNGFYPAKGRERLLEMDWTESAYLFSSSGLQAPLLYKTTTTSIPNSKPTQ